jgi:hypothetical protein
MDTYSETLPRFSAVIDDFVLHQHAQLDARQEVVSPRRQIMVGHLLVQEAHCSMFPVLARCHSKHPEPLSQKLRVKGNCNVQCRWEFPIRCRQVSHASGSCSDRAHASSAE